MEPCTPYQNHHHHSTVVTGSQQGRACWPYRVKLMSNIKFYYNYPCVISFTVPGQPENLRVQVLNFAVTISWQPPLQKNDIIIFYTITYNGSRNEPQPVSYLRC